MIHIFGTLSLYVALSFAFLQSILPLIGYCTKNPYFFAAARPCVYGGLAAIMSAYGLLTYAFISNDFSLLYVAANSHPLLPLMYRATAIWGAHEGSILLWILMLYLWTFVYVQLVYKRYAKPAQALAISLLGFIALGFLCFLIFTSNPFLLSPYRLQAQDLNPLLQDPGFVFHPPFLYLGYVGFSVTFAITLANLIAQQLTTAWARLARQFALLAWGILSLGISLGSWWSYRVLGWGGFWFWDPVENVSLLPWLSGLALIHILIVVEKKQSQQAWAVLLSIITFAMSILGTFLVRSGILISAHTFATDPARGLFLLLLLAVVLIATLAIYLRFYPHGKASTSRSWHGLARELFLLINSGLLIIALGTILLATLYPLILDTFHLGLISVGAPYFNTVLQPVLLLILLFMALSPMSTWQAKPLTSALIRGSWRFFISMLVTGASIYFYPHLSTLPAVIYLFLCMWIIAGLLEYFRFLPGMALAHLGFAILIVGIVLSSLLTEDKEELLQPGQVATVGPYQFFFLQVKGIEGSNYKGIRASFDVIKDKRYITTLSSDKRIYTVRDMVMTKVGIHPGLFRDLYIALGQPHDQDTWSVRLYYKPFIRFIWLGGILMLVGSILSIFRREQ